MGKTKGYPDDPMEDGQQTGSRGGSSHKGKHLNEWPPGIFNHQPNIFSIEIRLSES